jgi:hypothetical protein
MRIDQLLEIFNKVKSENPSVILSGSLALELQNLKLKRSPEDLDVYLPYGEKFKSLEGMGIKDAVFYLNDESSIKEEEYERTSYDYS